MIGIRMHLLEVKPSYVKLHASIAKLNVSRFDGATMACPSESSWRRNPLFFTES